MLCTCIFEGFHTDIACNRLSFENWYQAYYDVDVLTHTQERTIEYLVCRLYTYLSEEKSHGPSRLEQYVLYFLLSIEFKMYLSIDICR